MTFTLDGLDCAVWKVRVGSDCVTESGRSRIRLSFVCAAAVISMTELLDESLDTRLSRAVKGRGCRRDCAATRLCRDHVMPRKTSTVTTRVPTIPQTIGMMSWRRLLLAVTDLVGKTEVVELREDVDVVINGFEVVGVNVVLGDDVTNLEKLEEDNVNECVDADMGIDTDVDMDVDVDVDVDVDDDRGDFCTEGDDDAGVGDADGPFEVDVNVGLVVVLDGVRLVDVEGG